MRIAALLAALALLAFATVRALADTSGDTSCDGTVNAVDAALILQHAAGFAVTSDCPAKADVNGDGDVGAVDAALVLQYSAGLLATLGPAHTTTPTPTRTPAPKPTSGGVSALHTNSYYEDSGALRVVGIVQNDLPHEAELIEVTVRFYDGASTLLHTETALACVTTVPAGSASPFSARVFNPPEGIDRFTVSVTNYYEPPGLFFPAVTGMAASITSASTDPNGRRRISGAIDNTSANTYYHTQACLAFFNAAGDVVRTDRAFASPSTLDPGAHATFESSIDATGIVSEQVWLDATHQP